MSPQPKSEILVSYHRDEGQFCGAVEDRHPNTPEGRRRALKTAKQYLNERGHYCVGSVGIRTESTSAQVIHL